MPERTFQRDTGSQAPRPPREASGHPLLAWLAIERLPARWYVPVATFGRPAQILHPNGYTVLVWDKNLLAGIR